MDVHRTNARVAFQDDRPAGRLLSSVFLSFGLASRGFEDAFAAAWSDGGARRLWTSQNADLIVALEQGRVIETGRRADIVARNGRYAALLRHQAGAA